MAMKKSELEFHQEAYEELVAKAREAQREGYYRKAVELALASWEHIDGMMQYGRRYQKKEFDTIQGIELILKYAPLLFDFQSLNKLQDLLKSCRRIENGTSESLTDKLDEARRRMWDAHRMWDHLERNPETKQNELRSVLGGDQNTWRSVGEQWEQMGLIQRIPVDGSYGLALATRMGKVVSAKCPLCGAIGNAPKAMFLEEMECSGCQRTTHHVILLTQDNAVTKEQ